MTELSSHSGGVLGRAAINAELDTELAVRLGDLTKEPYISADCAASSRPIVIEGAVWLIAGACIWILTLATIGGGAL